MLFITLFVCPPHGAGSGGRWSFFAPGAHRAITSQMLHHVDFKKMIANLHNVDLCYVFATSNCRAAWGTCESVLRQIFAHLCSWDQKMNYFNNDPQCLVSRLTSHLRVSKPLILYSGSQPLIHRTGLLHSDMSQMSLFSNHQHTM